MGKDPLIMIANKAGVKIEDHTGKNVQITALSQEALERVYMGHGGYT
jgi:hypothetical protein